MLTFPQIPWPNFRRFDQTLDLVLAYNEIYGASPNIAALALLNGIVAIRPIKSRQVASIVIALMKEREGT